MQFNEQQDRALELVASWLQDPEQQVFRLFGYAGTGKTTLARHLGADVYAAFTGKAAHVLREKGCPNATTIHRLIYTPKEKSRERLLRLLTALGEDPDNEDLKGKVREERENLQKPAFTLNLESELRRARLLVIDECSMVNEQIGRDLMSFGCKILVLGDPAQLPPVKGGGFFTRADPNVLLTEVHRHALDNPIYYLATYIRKHGQLPNGHPLIQEGRATEEMLLGAEQLIVGRNATRHSLNRRLRDLLNRTSPYPEPGDKVVCTRNNHELGILNGATYTITEMLDEHTLVLDQDDIVVTVHLEPFVGEEVDHWAWRDRHIQFFEYGYALTCHKAQGSQWPNVGIIDESRAFGVDRKCWLYTAVTRAAEGLWIV